MLLLPAKTRYEQEGGGTETTTERRIIFSPEIPRQVGEGGEVTLGSSEQKRTVKRRLTRAARQMDKDVRYRRSEGNMIRFEVRSLSGN